LVRPEGEERKGKGKGKGRGMPNSMIPIPGDYAAGEGGKKKTSRRRGGSRPEIYNPTTESV